MGHWSASVYKAAADGPIIYFWVSTYCTESKILQQISSPRTKGDQTSYTELTIYKNEIRNFYVEAKTVWSPTLNRAHQPVRLIRHVPWINVSGSNNRRLNWISLYGWSLYVSGLVCPIGHKLPCSGPRDLPPPLKLFSRNPHTRCSNTTARFLELVAKLKKGKRFKRKQFWE